MTWISVDDRLPESEDIECIVAVMVGVTRSVWVEAFYSRDRMQWETDVVGQELESIAMCAPFRVTHWMPLPDPPEGGET